MSILAYKTTEKHLAVSHLSKYHRLPAALTSLAASEKLVRDSNLSNFSAL